MYSPPLVSTLTYWRSAAGASAGAAGGAAGVAATPGAVSEPPPRAPEDAPPVAGEAASPFLRESPSSWQQGPRPLEGADGIESLRASLTPRAVEHELIDQAMTAYFDDDMVEFSPRVASQPGAAGAPPSACMYAPPAEPKNRGVVSLGSANFKGRGFRSQPRRNRAATAWEYEA